MGLDLSVILKRITPRCLITMHVAHRLTKPLVDYELEPAGPNRVDYPDPFYLSPYAAVSLEP